MGYKSVWFARVKAIRLLLCEESLFISQSRSVLAAAAAAVPCESQSQPPVPAVGDKWPLEPPSVTGHILPVFHGAQINVTAATFTSQLRAFPSSSFAASFLSGASPANRRPLRKKRWWRRRRQLGPVLGCEDDQETVEQGCATSGDSV